MDDEPSGLTLLLDALHDTAKASKATLVAIIAAADDQGLSRDQLIEHYRLISENHVNILEDLEAQIMRVDEEGQAKMGDHAREVAELTREKDSCRRRVDRPDEDPTEPLVTKLFELESDKGELLSEHAELVADYDKLEKVNKQLTRKVESLEEDNNKLAEKLRETWMRLQSVGHFSTTSRVSTFTH